MATEKRAETHQYAPIESKGYESVLEGPNQERSRIRAWLSGCMLALSAVMAVPALAAHYPIHKLHTMVSQPGQDKIAFLVDVAHWLRAYSDRTGYEACARIASSNDSYGVVITTSESHIGCAINNTYLPEGMTATGDTIHSHGIDRRQRITNADKLFLPPGYDSVHIRAVRGQNTEHFSPSDYHGGPGYLAGCDALYYQDGDDQNIRVSSL